MNIISKLTVRHLAGNKKRTIVTILGIATSTALISAILLGVFSFFRFFGYVSTQTDGNVHAAFYELTKDQAIALKSDDRIAFAGVADTDPAISGVRLNSGREERFCVGNIMHADADYYSEMVVSEYEGILPADSSEIAVEEAFLTDNGITLSVGDTLSFEQGFRYTYEAGELVYLAGSYRSEEGFDAVSAETCRVTAILHGNRPTSGFDILRGLDPDAFPVQKYSEVRICLNKCDHTAVKQIKQIADTYGINKVALNTEYLISVFAFEGASGAYRSFFVLMAFALLIVVVTSVVLIVNSVGMSLAERMRYLGMLASVGATGRQKRSSIYFEALILGIIGIPIGILMGYIGSRVTLSVLGRRILEVDIIAGAEGMSGAIPVRCSPWIIVAIVLLSGMTVFISSLVPAMKAAKIMPVDALRQTDTIRVSAKKLAVSPVIRGLFGYEGELAYKNTRRNGIKSTVITVSIAVSMIMFLTISFFCSSIERVNQYDFDLPYQLAVSCSLSETEQLRTDLEVMDGVDKVFGGGMIQFLFEKKEDENYTLANKDITDPRFLTSDYSNLKIGSIALVIADDADFKALLRENGLSEERYFGDSLRGVLLNNLLHEKRAQHVFNEEIIGQHLRYDEPEGNPPDVEIGDFIEYDEKNYLFAMTPKGTVTVFVPASVYYREAEKTISGDILTADLCVVTGRHNEVRQEIEDLLAKSGYHNYSCSDLTDALAIMNTITLMLKTAMYGFTILLTLIAAANIVNTISTGVLLRRKEFAMYRSVGMTGSGFRKMIRLETFLYGIKAIVFGIPVSLLLSYLMYTTLDDKLYSFDPDLFMYLAVTAAVFAVVGLSMLFSMNRIRDDSIIEALKEDAV